MDIVDLIYRPWTALAARRALVGRLRDGGAPARGRFARGDVDRLLAAAWRLYEARAPALPRQPTAGSAMNVRLACFTLSFFDALLAEGIERGRAIELVADAAWGVYCAWGLLAAGLARLAPRRASALGFAKLSGAGGGRVSLRFPFNAPGYLVEPLRSEAGAAFDVVRCPVAAYFRERGAVDLCLASWCNLDYSLAEMTNQRLVRAKTLVEGADRCDFRVFPLDPRTRSEEG